MTKESWKKLLSHSITTTDQLAKFYSSYAVKKSEIQAVIDRYPMFVNPYFMGLMKHSGGPLWKQAIPDRRELLDTQGIHDPLAEDRFSPVPNIIHRYPDRVLFIVSNRCAMYCRFCTRKRKIGKEFIVNDKTIEQGITYIRSHRNIRDVLLSGGDPLLLEDDFLAKILQDLRSIPHIEIVRISTRVPCLLPQRITKNLANLFKQVHPVYIHTHFNHPDEITPEAARACVILADAGIPLGCQTVLLRGVNDTPWIMKQLMQKLVAIRVRPYYLHHMDLTRGTKHFRTTIQTGLSIIKALNGYTSGICVPHYVIDLPGGGGKVPLLPHYVVGLKKQELLLSNFQGKIFKYRVDQEDVEIFTEKGFSAS